MNTPDRATDHLANERTFLAWIRSAVALLGLGFVVAKFGFWLRQLSLLETQHATRSTGASLAFGLGLLAFGGLLAVVGWVRYRSVLRALRQGTFAPADHTVTVTAAAAVGTTLLLMVYLVVTNRSL